RVTVSLWVCSGTFPEMSTRPPERGLLAPWREWLKEQRESGNFGAWLQGWQLMLRLYVRQSAVAGIMGVVESHVNRLKMLKRVKTTSFNLTGNSAYYREGDR
ncbi:TPA: hypothetical protein ACGR12_005016, partial [Escherichia coli]